MGLEGFLIFLTGFTLMGGTQAKAGIQYRMSTRSLDKVAAILASDPNGYFDNEAKVQGQIGTFKYRLTNFRLEEVNASDVTVSVTKEEYLKIKANFTRMTLVGHITLEREESQEPLYQGPIEVVYRDTMFISKGIVEYVDGNGNTPMMTIMSCEAEAKEVSPGSDFLQATQTSVSNATVQLMLQDAVCSIFKPDILLEFPDFTMEFDMNEIKMHDAYHPGHLAVTNGTLLLTYETDDVSSPTETGYQPANFPPAQSTAAPFEIWFNTDVFNALFDNFMEQAMAKNGGKIYFNHILPIFPVPEGKMTSDDLKFFKKIQETFPDSSVDLYVTEGNLWFDISPEQCLLHMSLTLEVQITLNCDRSKRYTPLKFHINAFVPVQFGYIYNLEMLTFKWVSFGGNITVAETSIGRVTDESLSQLFSNLPQLGLGSRFEDLNKKIKGSQLSQLVPKGTFLHKVTVRIVQGYLVVQGDLTDEAKSTAEVNGNTIWLPEYGTDYLKDLWFPLIDDTPGNQKGIKVQYCKTNVKTKVTSGPIFLPKGTSGTILTSGTISLLNCSVFLLIFLGLLLNLANSTFFKKDW